LRSGFVAGSPSVIAALSDIKMVTTVATSDYVERFVFNIIQGGHYLRHLRRLRARLVEANRDAVTELETVGLDVRASKVPGFYLWAELPEHIDELDLCRAAAAESIFLAPGQVFHPHRAEGRPAAMRVNVAYGTDPRFLEFLRRSLNNATPVRQARAIGSG
jgi:DNA-binding transcriptional MocR family regulator